MHRILLDANMPVGLRTSLSGFTVETAQQRGWAALTDGRLLTLAEADGFDAFITADRNIPYQQNLTRRRIAIVELSTAHWDTVRTNLGKITSVLEALHPGDYVAVTCHYHTSAVGRRQLVFLPKTSLWQPGSQSDPDALSRREQPRSYSALRSP